MQFSTRVLWAPSYIPNAAIVNVLEKTCEVQSIVSEKSTAKGFEGIPTGNRRLVLTGLKDDIPHTFNIINPHTNEKFEILVLISIKISSVKYRVESFYDTMYAMFVHIYILYLYRNLYRRGCVCLSVCLSVCLCVYPSDGIHVVACGPIGTKFCTHMQIHLQMVVS